MRACARVLLLLLLPALLPSAHAVGVSVAPIFSDGMILQRSAPTAIFGGNATALAAVTVVVSEGRSGVRLGSGGGHADANGSWVVELAAPFVAAATNTTVTIFSDGRAPATLRGVAWGDIINPPPIHTHTHTHVDTWTHTRARAAVSPLFS